MSLVSMDDDARPAARLTVLSGPSGVGKDSVIELIRARSPWIKLSVSVTTRKKRDLMPGSDPSKGTWMARKSSFAIRWAYQRALRVAGSRRSTYSTTVRFRTC